MAFDFDALYERASRAGLPADREACQSEIERALASRADPGDRGRLLMCRARLHSNYWRTAEGFADTRSAMRLFERAGEDELVVDAASLASAQAARLGELTIASNLATRGILALDWLPVGRLRLDILHRLGDYCYSCLDYDRAVEFDVAALAVAEQLGADEMACLQLLNMADTLVAATRLRRRVGTDGDPVLLDRAEVALRRLFEAGSPEVLRRFASHVTLAELRCEQGRVDEALQVLDESREQLDADAPALQRAAQAYVQARCLRAAGRTREAVQAATTAVRIARQSKGNDDHELMKALEELAASQQAAADDTSDATAREVNSRMRATHERQTMQLVEEAFARARRDWRNSGALLAEQFGLRGNKLLIAERTSRVQSRKPFKFARSARSGRTRRRPERLLLEPYLLLGGGGGALLG